MKQYIEAIANRQNLTAGQAQEVFTRMVEGAMDPVEIAALLIGLRTKGETREEISGAARALRAAALPFARPDGHIADSCGTGGDGAGTINVSTAAAFVCAELGIPMAKHGNRSISSKCGSADVLESLGVRIDASPETARRCLDEANICFFFAPQYHSGLRHAGPVRRALGIRTVMNVLGPLVNPAAPSHQVMGVYDPALCGVLAGVLRDLGCQSALVVHGSGLDEIAVHGPTVGAFYADGIVEELYITPADLGLKEYALTQLVGGSPEENRDILLAIFDGRGTDAQNAAVAVNAGAVARVFRKAATLKEGMEMAFAVLRSGACTERLSRLVALSHA